eukprot:15039847-Heterocapsa_arctica.AAC.1
MVHGRCTRTGRRCTGSKTLVGLSTWAATSGRDARRMSAKGTEAAESGTSPVSPSGIATEDWT